MASRQSKHIAFLLLFLMVFCHQAKSDTLQFQSAYNDTDQLLQNRKQLRPGLNKATWEKLRKQLDFSEDTAAPQTDTSTVQPKQTSISSSSGRLKYVWYILTVVLIIVVLVILWPYFKSKNVAQRSEFMIDEQELDEEALRQVKLTAPLESALNDGNYKLAFRIKYLEVLQLLIIRNLIDYRKERTNTDYLLQLKTTPIYESFRQLTLSFDEVWYGDVIIDKTAYEAFSEVFDKVKQAISQA